MRNVAFILLEEKENYDHSLVTVVHLDIVTTIMKVYLITKLFRRK
jgi:phosphoglycerol transferase MdoB-like AlkP superfamily enzyme